MMVAGEPQTGAPHESQLVGNSTDVGEAAASDQSTFGDELDSMGGAGQRNTMHAAPSKREPQVCLPEVSDEEAYGLALFRRALVEHDDRAWVVMYTHYRQLVKGWVSRCSVDARASDTLVEMAFERFWRFMNAEKFTHFAELRCLLRYLKLCVQTAIVDYYRHAGRQATEQSLDCLVDDKHSGVRLDGVETQVLVRAERHEFWQMVRCHLRSDSELLLIRLTYIEGLARRQLVSQQFSNCQPKSGW